MAGDILGCSALVIHLFFIHSSHWRLHENLCCALHCQKEYLKMNHIFTNEIVWGKCTIWCHCVLGKLFSKSLAFPLVQCNWCVFHILEAPWLGFLLWDDGSDTHVDLHCLCCSKITGSRSARPFPLPGILGRDKNQHHHLSSSPLSRSDTWNLVAILVVTGVQSPSQCWPWWWRSRWFQGTDPQRGGGFHSEA